MYYHAVWHTSLRTAHCPAVHAHVAEGFIAGSFHLEMMLHAGASEGAGGADLTPQQRRTLRLSRSGVTGEQRLSLFR